MADARRLLRPVLKISPVYQTRKSNPNDNESDIWICGGAIKVTLPWTDFFIYLFVFERKTLDVQERAIHALV